MPTQLAYLRRTFYVSVLYCGCLPDVAQSIGVSTLSNFTMHSIVFAERGNVAP